MIIDWSKYRRPATGEDWKTVAEWAVHKMFEMVTDLERAQQQMKQRSQGASLMPTKTITTLKQEIVDHNRKHGYPSAELIDELIALAERQHKAIEAQKAQIRELKESLSNSGL